MIEITPRRLFKIGFFCFSIAGAAQFAGLVINFNVLNIFSKISTIANLIFTIAVVFSFSYLLDNTPKETVGSQEPEDITEIIKEFKKNGKRN